VKTVDKSANKKRNERRVTLCRSDGFATLVLQARFSR